MRRKRGCLGVGMCSFYQTISKTPKARQFELSDSRHGEMENKTRGAISNGDGGGDSTRCGRSRRPPGRVDGHDSEVVL